MSLNKPMPRWEKLSGSCTRERTRARHHPDDQRSRQFLDLENALVAELTRASGSQRQALALIALSRSTWHYRCKPRLSVADPVPQKDRTYRSRILAADRAVIEDKIRAGWQAGHSVDHSFACCWDDSPRGGPGGE